MRWADLNAAGHVDHCVIVDYLQEARVDLLCSRPDPVGSMLGSSSSGGGVLVTGHQLEYREQLFAGPDPLRIELWVDQVGGARFSISYRLWDRGHGDEGDRLVARARTFVTPYDLAAGALRRLTETERAQLRNGVEPAEEFPPLVKAGPQVERAHTAKTQVRWSDLDSYGHVNNTKFFDYLAEARNQLLGDALGLDPRSPEMTDVGWVVARQDVDYLAPIDFRRTPYEVRTAVLGVGTSSARLVAEILDPQTGRRFARAGTVLVGVDPATGRSRPWSDSARRGLAGPFTATA